jgi:hypothetical protein
MSRANEQGGLTSLHRREYDAYKHAKRRCDNPDDVQWKDYGGRGIRFLFTSFREFLSVVGPRPDGLTLERSNNDGHYEPGNVCWASRSVQSKNQRHRPHAERVQEELTALLVEYAETCAS